jgi:hypothetical protein
VMRITAEEKDGSQTRHGDSDGLCEPETRGAVVGHHARMRATLLLPRMSAGDGSVSAISSSCRTAPVHEADPITPERRNRRLVS